MIEARGFEIVEEKWVEIPLCGSCALLDNTVLRAWSMHARRG